MTDLPIFVPPTIATISSGGISNCGSKLAMEQVEPFLPLGAPRRRLPWPPARWRQAIGQAAGFGRQKIRSRCSWGFIQSRNPNANLLRCLDGRHVARPVLWLGPFVAGASFAGFGFAGAAFGAGAFGAGAFGAGAGGRLAVVQFRQGQASA